jgi:hypothetical protein
MPRQIEYWEPTPGKWEFVEGDKGFGGDFYEPPDPGYPPTIRVEDFEYGDVELAQLVVPVPENAELCPESGEPTWYGNENSNGKLMAAAPRLLQSLQEMVDCFQVSEVDPRFMYWSMAKDLVKELDFQPPPRRSILDLKKED